MRRGIRVALAALLASAVAAGGAHAQGQDVAVTVAHGDGTPPVVITVDDVKHWTDIARRSGVGSDVRTLHAEAIKLLTSFAWIDGEAREQGVAVSDGEVDTSYEQQKRQSFPRDADFRKFLANSGQTVADIKQRVRMDMLSGRIRDRVSAPAGATVSEQDVTDFIAQHPQHVPERRVVRLVLARTRAEAEAARAALSTGGNWKAVARRYSQDPDTKNRGGLYKSLTRGELPDTVSRAIFRAKPHRITGPVRASNGYYVFSVSAIHPATTYALDRETVRETLVSQAEQQLLDDFVAAFTAKWTARTTCAPAYAFAKECANRK